MPKIMYRPNPTPPPFVPPTPSYDSQINAISANDIYNESLSLELKFEPAQVPAFYYVEIYRNNKLIAMEQLDNLSTNDFQLFETFDYGSVPFVGEIKFYQQNQVGSDVLVWTATLNVSYL